MDDLGLGHSLGCLSQTGGFLRVDIVHRELDGAGDGGVLGRSGALGYEAALGGGGHGNTGEEKGQRHHERKDSFLHNSIPAFLSSE